MLEIRQKQGSRRPGPGCAPFANSRTPRLLPPCEQQPALGRISLLLWTTRERAVRARADDRNRGRKRAPGVERLLILLNVSEPTPPPPGRPSGHAALSQDDGPPTSSATQSRASLSASRRKAPWSSSTSSRPPVEPGATTSSACLLHGLSPASPRGPREVRQAPVSVGDQNSRPRAPTRRPERASAGGRLRPRPSS